MRIVLSLLVAVMGCQAQQGKENTPVPTVRLIVETNRGTNVDRTDTTLSAVRQKIQSTLERANLQVVEGAASQHGAFVRVHYGGCSIGGCFSVLTLTVNGKELSKTEMGFAGGTYNYDYPYIGEFILAMLTNDPSPLLRLLADPSITARSAAPVMLAELPQASVVSALADALTAGDAVRDNSMNALTRIAGKSTDPILWKPLFVAGADDEWIRRVFSEHPPQFTNSLLSMLSASKNPTTQSAAKQLEVKIKAVSK